MKKSIIAFIFVLLFIHPVVADAAWTVPSGKTSLLQQIAALKKEISRLQALLAKQKALARNTTSQNRLAHMSISSVDDLRPSQFYRGEYTALYAVGADLSLIPLGKTEIDSIHTYLWKRFASFAGADYIRQHVREFRVYSNRTAEYDAFVERSSDHDSWILGVNIYGLDLTKPYAVRDTDQLLIHELGHIILDEHERAYDAFVEEFWDSTDMTHASKVSREHDTDDREELISRYFDSHSADFVSEYAATSPLEDSGESVVSFVLESASRDGSEKSLKMEFFYQYPEFLTHRAQILRTQ